jgi:metal-responsive CopG/Arc/MetJ family transcriptional regulator
MKKRIQVTINHKLVDDAKRMMAARGFDSFSEFLESLIRDEVDRRKETIAMPVTRYPDTTARPAALNEKKK